MIRFFHAFVKITAFLPQLIVFRIKAYRSSPKAAKRCFKGPAILISNHTTVWDFAMMLFLFPFRTLRYVMAELLFEKPFLGWFLRGLGGIRVNRYGYDFAFLDRAERIMEKGGVVGGFPEGRLPLPGEERPLEFKPSMAYLALRSGAPVIPVFTDGKYFSLRRARVMIGEVMYAGDYMDDSLSERENIVRVNKAFRDKIMELEHELNRRTNKNG